MRCQGYATDYPAFDLNSTHLQYAKCAKNSSAFAGLFSAGNARSAAPNVLDTFPENVNMHDGDSFQDDNVFGDAQVSPCDSALVICA